MEYGSLMNLKRLAWYFNKNARKKLRIKELGGAALQPGRISVHVVEGDNPRSLALLAKAYKDVYEPGFPMPEEREPLSKWVEVLKRKLSPTGLTIAILGDDLDGKNPVPKAMAIGYYYKAHDVGLLAYLVTAPAWQGRGLGRALNEANNHALLTFAQNNNKPLQGIFLECNDPAKIKPEDDVMDPQKRIDMYKKWGAIVLPIDYVQPPLEPGGAKCDTLKLLTYPHPVTGEYPKPEAIKGYVTGLYTELAKYSGVKPQDSPDYQRIMLQIDAMPPLPPRSFPKPPAP